jgi:predicted DNA-binding transcriptional regulator YafY
MARTVTATELADEFNTTPRKVRRFLREQGRGVGQGKRYAMPATKTAMNSLHRKFDAWGGIS